MPSLEERLASLERIVAGLSTSGQEPPLPRDALDRLAREVAQLRQDLEERTDWLRTQLEARTDWLAERLVPAPTLPSEPSEPSLPADATTRWGVAPMPAGEPMAADPVRVSRDEARDIEWRLGADWLPRVGIGVLALGLVFFLKLAFDHGWVPRWSHPPIVVGLGLMLWGLGDVLRGRGRWGAFPQVLAGGGGVVAAAAAFAAHHVPAYRAATGIGALADTAVVLAIIAGLAAYGAWRRLEVLGAVATALGPAVALASGIAHPWTFALLVAFVLAMLAVAVWRAWGTVPVVGLAAGFGGLAVATALGGPAMAVLAANLVLALAFLAASARVPWATVAVPPTAGATILALLVLEAPPTAAALALILVAVAGVAMAWKTRRPAWPAAVSVGVVAVAALTAGGLATPVLAATNAVLAAAATVASLTGQRAGGPAAVALATVVAVAALGNGAALVWVVAVHAVVILGGAALVWLRPDAAMHLACVLAAWVGIPWILAVAGVAPWTTMPVILALACALAAVGMPLGQRGRVAQATNVVLAWLALQWPLAGIGAPWAYPEALILGGWHGVATVAAAAVALGVARLPAARDQASAWLGTGFGLLVLWPPLQFGTRGAVVAWCAVAATAAFLGRRSRAAVAAASVPAALALLVWLAAGPQSWAGGGRLAIADAGVAILLALAVSAFALLPDRSTSWPGARWAAWSVAALVVIAYLGQAAAPTAVTLLWASAAAAIVVAGFALQDRALRMVGLGVVLLAILRAAIVDMRGLAPAWRALAFVGIGALLLALSFAYARARRATLEAQLGPPP